MFINRRKKLGVGVLLSCALLLSACSGSGSGSGDATSAANTKGDPKGTFRWSLSIAVSSMDPATTPNVYDYVYLWPVYDRLTSLDDKTGDAKPMLAKSWKVADDATSITLDLRDDVTFSDGTKFNAEAVKANIERMLNDPASTVKGQLTNVAGVEVNSEYQVTIKMKGATAGPMPTLLGGFPGMMVSPKAFNDPNLKTLGAGAGPFKVVRNTGDQLRYEKYDGYYDKSLQTVAAIEAKALPDDQTRLNAAMSGDVDGAFIRGGQIADAEKAGLTVVKGQTPTPNGLEVNMTRAKFNDPKVRQAISYALDRDALATAAFGAGCTPNENLFAKGHWAYNDETAKVYSYNLDKAKSLMAEAGLKDGFSFEITSPNIPTWVTLITAIQAQLKKINIDVKLNVVAGAAGNARYWVEHKADALTSADPFLIDPSQMIQQYFGKGGLRNVADYDNPALNDLANKALATSDQAKRAGYYKQIQKIVTDEALSPFVICNQTTAWAFRPGVNGFAVSINGMWDYSKITVPAK